MLCPRNVKSCSRDLRLRARTMGAVTLPAPQALVGVAGYSRSGKSTFAAELAARVGGVVVSFGDVVRARAAASGLDPTDRVTLMEVGHTWASDDPAGICAAVLAGTAAADVVIIDGIRHDKVLEVLHRHPGFQLVFLATPDDLLANRLGGAVDPRRHPSERDVAHLEHLADVVVDGRGPVESMVSSVLAKLHVRTRSAAASELR